MSTPTALATPGTPVSGSESKKRPRDEKSSAHPRPVPPKSTAAPPNGTGSRSTPVPNTASAAFPQRIKPPPVQAADLIIVPRIPTTHLINFEEGAKIPLNTDKPFTKSETSASYRAESEGFDNNSNNSGADQQQQQLWFTDDHPQNRRGFKYTYCVANPSLFPALQYTSVELGPYHGAFCMFDRSPSTAVSLPDRMSVSTIKGFVSARADVCVRTGHWYYEVRMDKTNDGTGAHVRVGLTRREASLEAPVGFDAYGYGVRDVGGQKVHLSRPAGFMDEDITTGDVLGFHVYLPEPQSAAEEKPEYEPTPANSTAWRDRIAIKYKGQLYFEALEYQPTKEMEELVVPLPEESGKTKKKAPPEIAKLPGSFVRVYKNGKYMGTPFQDLNSFWPPHSKQHQLSSRGAASSAVSLDDGMLGYFPTASVFRGGQATFNFGPDFTALPAEVSDRLTYASSGAQSSAVSQSEQIRPLCERYDEQIAEDIVQDIVDEVDFEVQDALEALMDADAEK